MMRLMIALALAATSAVLAAQPPAAATAGAPVWVGHAAEMEAHLRNASIVRVEEIGTGVTRPRRAYLTPQIPFASLAWKVLPPGFRRGHWESYKSEIAAYALDQLLEMDMVPPAIERTIERDTGAAVMWVDGTESVKERGGKMPTGAAAGKSIRIMRVFDDFIGNPDRNAGNILVDASGHMILIDHSRAFLTDDKLPWKLERVDAGVWQKIQALPVERLRATIGPLIRPEAVDAMIRRRDRMKKDVDVMVAKKGAGAILIP
jgi:hypothetical protein